MIYYYYSYYESDLSQWRNDNSYIANYVSHYKAILAIE